VGGFGPVVPAGQEPRDDAHKDFRTQAVALLGSFRSGQSLRPHIESLDPLTYLSSSYAERWVRAAEAAAVASGVLTPDDLDRWQTAIADGEPVPSTSRPDVAELVVDYVTTRHSALRDPVNARFTVGDAVLVRRIWDDRHHHRCPRYVRGVVGAVERVIGASSVPDGPNLGGAEVEYTVAFASSDLWGNAAERPFSVFIDLYEHYLEAA
jgi:nitrile hydratase